MFEKPKLGDWGDIYDGATKMGMFDHWELQDGHSDNWQCSIGNLTLCPWELKRFQGQIFTVYLDPVSGLYPRGIHVGRASNKYSPDSRQLEIVGTERLKSVAPSKHPIWIDFHKAS